MRSKRSRNRNKMWVMKIVPRQWKPTPKVTVPFATITIEAGEVLVKQDDVLCGYGHGKQWGECMMCNKHMKIVLFLNKTIIIEPETHRSFRYGQYRGGRGVGWAGGGPVWIWAGRKVRWVDDVKISKMKIVLFFDKTIETHRKNHRSYRYRYYRGGTRVGEAGGGQRGRRVLLQVWCDGWRSPHEVSNVIPVYLFKYMVAPLNIAAFCYTYSG